MSPPPLNATHNPKFYPTVLAVDQRPCRWLRGLAENSIRAACKVEFSEIGLEMREHMKTPLQHVLGTLDNLCNTSETPMLTFAQ